MKNTSDKHVAMEWDRITDYIIIGTNLCCSAHAEGLYEIGIETDIDLEEERSYDPMDLASSLWLPTIDHTAPTMDQLLAGTALLGQLEKRRKIAYVHCKNGHGRAPTLVAAYFIRLGLMPKDAVKKIAAKRKEIHIEEIQLARLEEFASLVQLPNVPG